MSRFEDLSRAVSKKFVTPSIPVGRVPFVPEEEDEGIAKVERDHSSSWSAFIIYTDARSADSMRRITCKRVSGFGKAETITSWCHERGAYRTFRVDRIRELVCAESGEVLDPGSHFESLWLRGALNVDDKALAELARVLVFLARCDGQYHPLEQSALTDCFTRYALRFGGCDRDIENALDGCGRLAPDGGDLLTALGKFAQASNGPKLSHFVLECGAGMIDADGRHAPEEISWALELSAALKRIADRR